MWELEILPIEANSAGSFCMQSITVFMYTHTYTPLVLPVSLY